MSIKNKKILFMISVPLILGVLLAAKPEINTRNSSEDIVTKEETNENASSSNRESESKENISVKESEANVSNESGNVESSNNEESSQKENSSSKNNTVEVVKLDEKKGQEENSVSAQNVVNNKINYKDKIKIDGSVSEELIELLNDELNKIPSSIMNKYFDIGGKIILTSYDIATTYYNDYAIGSLMELHDARQQILYISARSKAIKQGAIHGMGHAFDSITGWTSYKTNEFINIFNEEKNTIKTVDGGNYHKTNEREYFAEAFYSFIVSPSTTRSSAPKTVSFLENLMSKL